MKRPARRIALPGAGILGVTALVIAGGMVAVHPLAAHHSMAMYDSRSVTLIGTVVEFQWTNPHVYVMVKGTIDMDDEPAVWLVETAAPSGLVRLGWSAASLRPGDRVSVVVNPHHDPGEKIARLVSITLLDTGQELAAAPPDTGSARP